MTKDKMFENTVKKVVSVLESVGVQSHVHKVISKPEKVLRDSWYVDKVKQCGVHTMQHIDCHLNGADLGFVAVGNDGMVFTGKNIMIDDFFSSYATWNNSLEEYPALQNGLNLYHKNEDYEDILITCKLPDFERTCRNLYENIKTYGNNTNIDIEPF